MLKLDNIFIDVGVKDKDEVLEMGIYVGCVIIFEDEFSVLNNCYYVGWVLDNRFGGFCIVEVVCMFRENKVEFFYSLYIVNVVQEEVGLRGVEMVVYIIKLDVVIVIDVMYDIYIFLVKFKKIGDVQLGKGFFVIYVFVVYNKLLDFIIDIVFDKEILFQCEVFLRCIGMDIDVFVYSNGGVFFVLIFLLLRYMYIIVEMVYKEDVENVIKLIYEILFCIENGYNFKYFQF